MIRRTIGNRTRPAPIITVYDPSLVETIRPQRIESPHMGVGPAHRRDTIVARGPLVGSNDRSQMLVRHEPVHAPEFTTETGPDPLPHSHPPYSPSMRLPIA
jgi:hypothetical protein